MRAASALILVALLTACDGTADRPSRPPPAEPATGLAPAADRAGPFFVGRWAARPDLCDDGAWVITAHDVNTAGEVACRFQTVAESASGYDAPATCWAEGPPQEHRLRFAEGSSAQTLRVSGGPFADMSLIRCQAPAEAGA